MNCRKALLLISPHLDGAISKNEEAALAEHVAGCSACACELALAEKLSRALRELRREEVTAPPALCDLVMAKVREERRGFLRKLPLDAWRRALAVAAAVLLIASGSAGVNAGLKLGMGAKMLGYQTASPEAVVEPDKGGLTPESPPGDRVSRPNSPAPLTIADNSSGNTGTGNATGNSPEIRSVPTLSDASPVGEAPGNVTPSISGTNTLLSSEIKLNSTVLKVAVDDLAGAKAKAISLAIDSGTVVQVYPEQNNGKNVLFIRITVASDQASGIIAGLEGIGTLIDRQDESRDITSLYNETLVQYHDLQYQISAAGEAATKQQLETQALSYKQQLDAWTTEANKQTINLWLESNI